MKPMVSFSLLACALAIVGCDDSDGSTNSSGNGATGGQTVLTSFAGLDFESIVGDSVPASGHGHSPSSVSGTTKVNRTTPLAGTASARISSILNGTNYSAYTWNSFYWDMSWGSKFILDMRGARGICFRIRANKSHKVDVIPYSSVYTQDQDNVGAQFTWTINVRKTEIVDTLLFEDLDYPAWLWDASSSSGKCAIDSARYCPHTVAEVISRSPSVHFTINTSSPTSVNDSVTLDIDDIKLVY